jgi:hypothetical protein
MLSIEQGLRAFLLSRIANVRIYPYRLPQQPALPAATYQRIRTTPSYTHNGDTCADDVRIQVSTFALSLGDADELTQKIRSAMSGLSGDMGGVRVGRVFLRNQVASYDPDVNYYVIRQDYIIGRG